MLNVRHEGDRVEASGQRLKGEHRRSVGLHLGRLEVAVAAAVRLFMFVAAAALRSHLVQANLRLGVDANGGAGDVEALIFAG